MNLVRSSLLILSLSGLADAQGLDAQLIVSGLSQPVDVAVAPGDSSRWMVTQRAGLVRLIKDGVLQGAPFLDISGQTVAAGEGGLLGLAFHPQYASNGRLFLHYSDLAGDTAVVEYQVSADPDVADPTPVQMIHTHFRPFYNHFGGALEFGPDGKLYLSQGDGGLSGDSQDLGSGLGKILRFDVDVPAPFIPADNPFVGVPGALEAVWAVGLRNPWQFGFDPDNGDLWIGDVGQTAFEEISVWRTGDAFGANFGWPCKEGNKCHAGGNCNCDDPALVPPTHVYPTGQDCSVIGGTVYRGSAIPGLVGSYLFADYCSGRFWTLRIVGGETVVKTRTAELDAINQPTAFGLDPAGELLVCAMSGGGLWRIVPAPGASATCDTTANSSGQPALIRLVGSPSITDNDLHMRVTQAPPNVPGYFLMSTEADFLPGFGGSEGILCLGSPILRFSGNVLDSGANGRFNFTPDLNALPGGVVVAPGEDWLFQCWFRDVDPAPTSNTSDALSVRFGI